jgi:hypothetical protein
MKKQNYVLLSQDFARLKDNLLLVFTPPMTNDVPGDFMPGFKICSQLWQLAALETSTVEE